VACVVNAICRKAGVQHDLISDPLVVSVGNRLASLSQLVVALPEIAARFIRFRKGVEVLDQVHDVELGALKGSEE